MAVNRLLALAVLFLLCLSLYLKALAPTIIAGDSPELLTAAYNLGIAHPSGYSFFSLTGKIFIFLPLGEIAWRVNFFNAITTALCAALLPLLIFFSLTRFAITNDQLSWLISLGGGFFFGLNLAVFNQGLITEVYPLFWLCFILALLALRRQNYYLAALLTGLGINGHYACALTLPGLLFWTKKPFWATRNLLLVLLWAFLGFGLIIYMPLRAAHKPVPAWGNPDNWQRLLAKVTLQDWGQRPGVKRSKSFSEYLTQLGYLLKISVLVLQSMLLFALIGLLALGQKDKYFASGLLVICLMLFLTIGYLNTYPSWQEASELGPKFLVPFFIALLLATSYGISWLAGKFRPNYQLPLVLALTLLWPTITLSHQHASWRTNFLAYDYGHNLLSSLPEDYYLFGAGDAAAFPIAYLKYVRGMFPEAEVTGSIIFPPQQLKGRAPLYTTMQVGDDNLPYAPYRLFFVEKSFNPGADWPAFYHLRGVGQPAGYPDMMSQFTLSKYYQFQGLYAFEKGQPVRGLRDFAAASQLTRLIVGEHYNYGLLLKYYGQPAQAAAEFRYFLTGFPHVLPGYYQLGMVYLQLRQPEQALEVFNLLYRKNPRFADVAARLKNLTQERDQYKNAPE